MTDPRASASGRPRRRGLFELIGEIPALVTSLVEREIALIKTEVITKLRALGVGVGLLAVAGLVLLGMVGVLLTAAVLALALIMPGWLAALLVAAAMLLLALLVALVGYRVLKRGIPPLPTESIGSLRRDLRAIQGIGKRGTQP